MAKYEDQLERMNFLMEYKNPVKETRSNVEFHATGADGKVYGIVKEGTKYYIKEAESGKENIAESYEYIGGFTNKKENEFTDYNKATKHLELKLMSLNEAYGKKSNVSTVDFKRNEKALAYLTEEARKELDRMNQIFENSCKIGRDCVCDPESKGSASPEDTEKNNDPFDKKVTPDMDYKGSKGTVGESTEGDKVSDVSGDLQSDKMKTKNSNLDDKGNDKEYKKTEDDLEGESVAAQEPKDAKAVIAKVNEGIFEKDAPVIGEPSPLDDMSDDEISPEDFEGNPVGGDLAGFDNEEPALSEPEKEPISDEEFDKLLEEFSYPGGVDGDKDGSAITGSDAILDKENNPINGTNNGVDDEKGEDWKRIEESEDGNVNDPTKQGDEDTLKNLQYGYNDEKKLDAQSWDKMNEAAVKSITESIFNKLVRSSKKESLQEMINRIVKEEVTKLDAWGKHPKYQKEPMTTPDNKEVLAGTADRDFNDDSAKGSESYGKKIGSSAPFEKVVDILTDQVIAKIKSLEK